MSEDPGANKKQEGDRGWNDPPMLNYGPSNPPPKSRIMNKRVAFPVAAPNTSMTDKPTPISTIPRIPPEQPTASKNVTEPTAAWDSSEKLLTTLSNFNSIIGNNKPKGDEDIDKNIESLKEMWQQGKLNKRVQQLVFKISEALLKDNQKQALDYQFELVAENLSGCNSWLLGLRHLIQNVQTE